MKNTSITSLTTIESAVGSIKQGADGKSYGNLTLTTADGPVVLTLTQFDEIYKGFVRCWPTISPLKEELNIKRRAEVAAEKQAEREAAAQRKADEKAKAAKDRADKLAADKAAKEQAKADREAKAKAEAEAKAKAKVKADTAKAKAAADKLAKDKAAKGK